MARKPKKFTEFSYRENGYNLTIPVFANQDGNHISFSAGLTDFKIHESDTDVEKLRQKLFDKLRIIARVEWVPYLYIRVGGNMNYRGNIMREAGSIEDLCSDATATLQVEYELVGIGKDNKGQEYWCKADQLGDEIHYSDQHPDKGRPKLGHCNMGDSWSRIQGNASLVPDTPVNRAALAELLNGMARLRSKLHELLAQENVDKSLLQLGGNLALPAPHEVMFKEPIHDNAKKIEVLHFRMEDPDLLKTEEQQ